jgi:hypothetical protein
MLPILAVRVVCANDVLDAIKTESASNQIAHLRGMTLSCRRDTSLACAGSTLKASIRFELGRATVVSNGERLSLNQSSALTVIKRTPEFPKSA